MPDVIVVGQLARDLVLLVDDVPDAGGTAPVRRRRELLGGKGANQAVALAQLGTPAGLLAVAGDDEVGDRLLAQAGADGVDTATVRRRPGARTGLIVDVVDGRGTWRYLEDLPPDVLLTADDVAAAGDALRTARAVLVQLQQPAAATLAAARAARAGDALLVLDGAPDADATDELLALADVLRVDAREAEQVVGDRPADADAGLAAGRTLVRRGPALAVVEVAGLGNAFVWSDGDLFLPLSDTPTVDSTGAGDAFVAALTHALLRGESRESAARLAVAAAGSTVGHPGGRPDLRPEALRRQLDRVTR